MKPVKLPKQITRLKLPEGVRRLKLPKAAGLNLDRRGLLPLALLVLGLALGTGLGLLLAYNRSAGPATTEVAGESAAPDTPLRSGPFRLAAAVSPEKPVIGRNRLRVVLRDLEGRPVSGAALKAVAEMPAMGAMPAMRAPAAMAEVAPGIYEGDFDLAMDGAWPLGIEIEKEGLGKTAVTFDMATSRAGLRLSSGAVAAGSGREPAAGPAAPEALPPGTIALTARRRQLIGVEMAVAEQRPLERTIRAYGQVGYDETRLSDVNLKYDAWIGQLQADFVGARVDEGDVLFTIFSPELFAAQREYLEVRKRTSRSPSGSLLEAARRRLSFWGLTPKQIKSLEERGGPQEYVPVLAPQTGVVVVKNVIEGTGRKAGTTLMRIADLSAVWIEAEVYEADLALISPGMGAAVELPYGQEKAIAGTVDYVYPYLEGGKRTGRMRLTVPNPDGVLKPGMYADVRFRVPLGRRLAVPESAVLVAGDARVVFEDLGDGRLAPRYVATGRRAGGYVEIVSGLEAGDRVVTSGNFLIASESKLKAGLRQW